jgi:hypothetical protein
MTPIQKRIEHMDSVCLAPYFRALRPYRNGGMISVMALVALILSIIAFAPGVILLPVFPSLHLIACLVFFYGMRDVFRRWPWRVALLPDCLEHSVAAHAALSSLLLLAYPLLLVLATNPQCLRYAGFAIAIYAVTFDFAPKDERKSVWVVCAFLATNGVLATFLGYVFDVFREMRPDERELVSFGMLLYVLGIWVVAFTIYSFLIDLRKAPWSGRMGILFSFATAFAMLGYYGWVLSYPKSALALFSPSALTWLACVSGVSGILLVILKCRSFARGKGPVETPERPVATVGSWNSRGVSAPFKGALRRVFHWRYWEKRGDILLSLWFSLAFVLILFCGEQSFDAFNYSLAFFALFGINARMAGKLEEGNSALRWQSLFPLRRERFLKEYLGAVAFDGMLFPHLVMTVSLTLVFLLFGCSSRFCGLLMLLVANLCFQPFLFGITTMIIAFSDFRRHAKVMATLLLLVPTLLVGALILVLLYSGLTPREFALHMAPLVLLGLCAGAFMTWLGYRRLMNTDLA